MAVGQAGGLKITHTVSPDMEDLKPELPFGQVKLSAYLFFYLAYRFDAVEGCKNNSFFILLFFQLPYLVDGDVKLAQSMAILRYLSKKGGLQGDTDAAYAVSEMFIEEVSLKKKCSSFYSNRKVQFN